MKIKIKKSVLLQAVKRVLAQGTHDHPDEKGTNILAVLKTAQNAGKDGRSWTNLHNAINGKPLDSDWSNQNRGTNISRIARCSGKPRGSDEDGQPEQVPYDDQPLIKKMQNGNYMISQVGITKLKQLERQLGQGNKEDNKLRELRGMVDK